MELQVLHVYAAATPEHLVGIVHLDVLYVDVVHLAEHLWRVDNGVLHLQVIRIPQGGTASHGEVTVLDGEAVDMPEGVVALETAVRSHDVAALLDGRLALADGHVVDVKVVRGEERTLSAELCVSYKFHIILPFVLFHGAKLSKKGDTTCILFTDKTTNLTVERLIKN